MKNNSLWLDNTTNQNYETLQNDITADVCIIGAGIVGITVAYLLNQQGLKVILLEKDKICHSVTANTTGKITSQHGLFYHYLISNFGKEFAKKYLESHNNAISFIYETIQKEKIDCDFEWQPNYVYTNSDEKLQEIKLEVGSVNSLGFPATFCEKTDLPFKIKGAICFPDQAMFHARKYCIGLAHTLPNNTIFENSRVIDLEKQLNQYVVKTESGSVCANYVVMASHYPICNFPGLYFLKMYQDKSYLIGVDTKKDLFPGMYISAEESTFSFRSALTPSGKRILLVGGNSHKTGDNSICMDDCFKPLEDMAHSLYAKSDVLYRWSTEDCVTLDKVPYIGQFSHLMPNVFVATGFKKWGMASSQVAANIIRDKILEIDNPYADIYTATRFEPLHNAKETGNMLKQTSFSLFLNKITPATESFENLKVGTGGVVDYHGKKLGIYRKSKNEIFAVSPYCAHLGCELSWNNLEKTWDCPCHGSRYDYTGKLLMEPSKKDLDTIQLED